MKHLSAAILIFLLGGCASFGPQEAGNEVELADSDQVVCKREKITGSNRIVRVCRTLEQIKRDKENADAFNRGLIPNAGAEQRPGG